MAFQPYNLQQQMLYPSQQQKIGPQIYAVNNLDSAGDRLYAYEIGDYAYPSLTPVPNVQATLFMFADNTETITVYRTVGTRTFPVRGQINVYAVGGRNVVDWEAPAGVPITYRAEQFDSTGLSLGYGAPFSTQLDFDDTYIQNVFDPAHAVPVTMASTAAASLKRTNNVAVYYPSGAGAAVAIGQQRQGLSGTDVSFYTLDQDTTDQVRAMFGDPYTTPSVPPIVCIRTGSTQHMGYPQPFYALISDPDEQPVDANTGGTITRWVCTATEVAPPAPALVAPVLTYADLDTTYSTYAAMDAAYGSYLERDRDYSLAGVAETDAS